LAAFAKSERLEAIDLQLEDKLVGIEWLNAAGKPYGGQVSTRHLTQ